MSIRRVLFCLALPSMSMAADLNVVPAVRSWSPGQGTLDASDNLAERAKASATASDAAHGFTPEQATDEDSKTRGSSGPTQAEPSLALDLGKSNSFNNVAIDRDRIRVGKVTIDRALRCIRFPAIAQPAKEVVSHAVVFGEAAGQTSLFLTSASPKDIHLACLLLGVKPPSSVDVAVEWASNGSATKSPLLSMLSLSRSPTSGISSSKPTDAAWAYLGSGFDSEGFMATRSGAVIALSEDPTALIRHATDHGMGNSFRVSRTGRMPDVGTPVTITLTCPILPARKDATVPADWLNELAANGKTINLTLPNGTLIGGSVDSLDRTAETVQRIAGAINHPESGSFEFLRIDSPRQETRLEGTLRLDSQATEWALAPSPDRTGRFQLCQKPAADAFRPRNQKLPDQTNARIETAASIRADGESKLRKTSPVTEISPERLRFGQVEVWKDRSCIRIPVTLAEREKVVEYLLVTTSGKIHESLLTTTAEPGDIYLALLELGLTPFPCGDNQSALEVRVGSNVRLDVEWDQSAARPIMDFITANRPETPIESLPDRMWHFNGSRFSPSSFAAKLEGSIISLIADDLALLNNTGQDRADDDSHFPITSQLPSKNPAGTLVISRPLAASKPNAKPSLTRP